MHQVPIDKLQSYARRLGVGFTLIAALMAASAGYKFGGDSLLASVLLAGLLGGLTIATALMLNFVDLAWVAGERGIAIALAGIFGVMAVAEYGSHVAFGTSHRQANIETATLQTTRYDDTRRMIADSEASIKLFTERLATLEGQNAWITTINAEALRAQMAAETRRGGCGPKCLDLQAKIAVSEETQDLRKQIAGTKAALAKLRTDSAKTEKGDSIALNQSGLFATVATGSLAPTAGAVAWANIGIGAYLSLMSTFLGGIFNWLGFHQFVPRGRRSEPDGKTAAPAPRVESDFARKIRDAIDATMPKAHA